MIWAGISAYFPVQFPGIDIDVANATPISLTELRSQFRPQSFHCRQPILL